MNLDNKTRLKQYAKAFSERNVFTMEHLKQQMERLRNYEFIMEIPLGGVTHEG